MSEASITPIRCHPSVREMWEFNLSQNHKINTMFLAKIYTAASWLLFSDQREHDTAASFHMQRDAVFRFHQINQEPAVAGVI